MSEMWFGAYTRIDNIYVAYGIGSLTKAIIVFIPKVGKKKITNPKSFRPISPRTIEKVVESGRLLLLIHPIKLCMHTDQENPTRLIF